MEVFPDDNQALKTPEHLPIGSALFDLDQGPISLALGDHKIMLAKPQEVGANAPADSMVVLDLENSEFDEETQEFSVATKVITDDEEEIVLGRSHQYGVFEFGGDVSRDHIAITKVGNWVWVTDLDSSNGTEQIIPPEAALPQLPEPAPSQDSVAEPAPQPQPQPEPKREEPPVNHEVLRSIDMAGYSMASEDHPDRNEDNFFIDEEGRAMGVFDGLGGHPGSEEASELAAQVVDSHLASRPDTGVTVSTARFIMEEAVQEAHVQVELTNITRKNEAIAGSAGVIPYPIATTANIAKLFESKSGAPYMMVANAGDSRAYLLRDGELQHLTLDHAVAGVVDYGNSAEFGKAMQDQALLADATSPSALSDRLEHQFRERNILSSCLGQPERGAPAIGSVTFGVQSGDKIILTTDGIHDNLTNSEIESIIDDGVSAEGIVKALVEAARNRSYDSAHARSKKDDMTATALVV